MKKILFGIISVLFLSIVSVNTTYASNIDAVNYDMSVGGTQYFEKVNSNGDKESITVSEDNNFDKLANKVYTVSKKGNGWHVSYKVKISSNKIVSAYGLSAVATVGSFKSSSLKKLSSTSAKWSAVYLAGLIKTNVSCTATISGGSLHIS